VPAEDFRISAGSPDQLGLALSAHGGNFALYSETATAVDFCLFDAADREIARLRLPGRSGPVFHGFIHGLQAGALYGLRVHGPYDPSQGARHNPAKLLIDPYALGLDRPIEPHPSMQGFDADGLPSRDDSAPFVAKAIAQSPVLAQSPARAKKSWAQTLIYELHVRGFTKLMPEIPERWRGTFAGLAHPAAIARLQNLGVTTLELLPCAAWIDERHLPPLGLTNYWGYNSIAFMAPDPRLAPGGWQEVRESVAALQAAGFDVLIDIVLNHSGESDEFGPTLSLRGIDNATYYRLGENPAHYVNDAGCGNILRFDHPAVVRLAMDTLRAWAQFGGIDGFRFDLAVTLARRRDGFDAFAPLIAAIDQDPVLRHLKMIAEPWDVGPGGYRVGEFPPRWSDWNDIFRDDMRKFWRGDSGMIGALATGLAGSEPIFGRFGRPTKSVNFVTAHDGFTLADLVAYAHKHNEANGEQNRDGTDANHSWNNGVEGPTDEARILALRRRDQRNLLATLFCARGVPMLAMGGECGHSQSGNNNAYAQDNFLAWIDWGKADTGLIAFTKKLIALRMSEAALHSDAYLTGALLSDGSIPDAKWFSSEGDPMRDEHWGQVERRFIGLSLYVENSRALILLNAGGAVLFPLPAARAGKCWRLAIDTFADETAEAIFGAGESLLVETRSAKILTEVAETRLRSD
jgi:glycogen operon protein